MKAVSNHLKAYYSIAIYLTTSIMVTSFLFFIDSDDGKLLSTDTIIMLTVFVLLFTASQCAVSKVVSKSLLGINKIMVSIIGGIMIMFSLYILIYSVLFWVKS